MGKFLDGAGLAHFYEKVRAYVDSHMGGTTIEEYDTDDGVWHVRKWSSGYCELLGKKRYTGLNVATPWGSGYTLSSAIGGIMFPFPLIEKYNEQNSLCDCSTTAILSSVTSGNGLTQTDTVGVTRLSAVNNLSLTLLIYVTGRWKEASGNSGGLAEIPSGLISIWYGSIDTIPDGWALCNGENSTPDLRDRFVLGAGADYAVGATGGEETHKLTVNEMPTHSHSYTGWGGTYLAVGAGTSKTGALDGNATKSAGGSAAHNNMPPYYALCYIMKL